MEYWKMLAKSSPKLNQHQVCHHCMLTHHDPDVEKWTSYFTYRKLYETNSKIIIFHIILISLTPYLFIYEFFFCTEPLVNYIIKIEREGVSRATYNIFYQVNQSPSTFLLREKPKISRKTVYYVSIHAKHVDKRECKDEQDKRSL